ncbi:MAG: molybdenum cofactor guanylyltransferase [Acidimicrobiia bacterium]
MPVGVLLTGGASRRLGVDKATLVVDGETLARRAARLLGARCDPVVEVGPGHTDLPVVREDPPGQGPLAALAAAVTMLAADGITAPDLLLLACDLPGVEPVLDALAAAAPAPVVVPLDASGRRQYACARLASEVWRRAPALVEQGMTSLRDLLATVADEDVVELGGFAPESLADVDTPDAARRLGIDLPR